MRLDKRFIINVIIPITILTLLLSGCGVNRNTESKAAELNPRTLKTYDVAGMIWPVNPEQMISPDNKWVLGTRSQSSGFSVVAMPLSGSSKEPVSVARAEAEWLKQNLFGYYPLGWKTTDAFLFIAAGTQPDGPHKDKQGVSIRIGSVSGKSAEEIGWLELDNGMMSWAEYLPQKDRVYFHVTQAVWEFDVTNKQMRKIKGELPDYDGFFYPKLSPSGDYFVYELYEEDKKGVYLLDAKTGEERPLLPAGDNLSFYPAWSPDGKYIAAYTVPLKAGQRTGTWSDYDYLPAEDGPQPVSPVITVVDVQGRIVNQFKVEGKLLSGFRWSNDSNTLGFAAGVLKNGEPPGVNFESVWLGSVASKDNNVTKLADISQMGQGPAAYVFVDGMDATGKGMISEVYRESGSELYYVREGKEPLRVVGSLNTPGMTPVFQEYVLGLVQTSGKAALWLFGKDKAQKTMEFSAKDANILGYNESMVVVSSGELPSFDENMKRTINVIKLLDD
ncbi:MAG TPA: hypothetical protein GXX40_06990 [Firmicutes bacterium]|nr:hypothetical protein [Bacillota bacterium]